MTINVAWTQSGYAFVMADSAKTYAGPPTHAISSLGQRNHDDDGLVVEDNFPKLFRVGTHAIATLCGDAETAAAFAATVRKLHLDRGEDLVDAIFEAHAFTRKKAGKYRSIIAHWKGESRLLGSASEQPFQEIDPQALVAIGSMTKTHQDVLIDRVGQIPSMHPSNIIGAALAAATTFGVQEDLIACSVGGAFFGAFVGPEGVVWQDDILYVLFDPDLAGPEWYGGPEDRLEFVNCRVRDEVLTTYSTLTSEVRATIPDVIASSSEWHERWRSRLTDKTLSLESQKVALIPTCGGTTIFICGSGVVFRDHDSIHLREDLAAALATMTRESRGHQIWPADTGGKHACILR